MFRYFVLLLLALPSVSFATQQIREVFITDEISVGIDTKPLEFLYTHEEIHLMLDTEDWCSANWRGYKGTWELQNGELYLTSLVKGACNNNPPLVDPVLFFGEQEYPVKAKWFSGQIEHRLSDNTFLSCKSMDGQALTYGYTYEAMVYEFSTGDFVYKSKQTLREIWQVSLELCSDEGQ